MNGWGRINCDILCMLDTHKGPCGPQPTAIRASHSLVPFGIHEVHTFPALVLCPGPSKELFGLGEK